MKDRMEKGIKSNEKVLRWTWAFSSECCLCLTPQWRIIMLCFLPGSTQWYHGPVQRIWVVSFQHVRPCLCLRMKNEQYHSRNVVSTATWTTVRRSKYPRTTSTRGRRTSGLSALSCCVCVYVYYGCIHDKMLFSSEQYEHYWIFFMFFCWYKLGSCLHRNRTRLHFMANMKNMQMFCTV